jgi:hypothetical protein
MGLQRVLGKVKKRLSSTLGGGTENGLRDIFKKYGVLHALCTEGSAREWQQLAMYSEVLFQTKDLPGDIVEFGVGSGISLLSFWQLNRAMEGELPELAQRKIYGFDSFEGLPELTDFDNPSMGHTKPTQMVKGGYNGEGYLPKLFEFQKTHANIFLIKGWFNKTLPVFLKQNEHAAFSLIHIDCDLYESTRDSLTGVFERVVPGGVILFDEIFHPRFPGEAKAFWEVFNSSPLRREFSVRRASSMPWKSYFVRGKGDHGS